MREVSVEVQHRNSPGSSGHSSVPHAGTVCHDDCDGLPCNASGRGRTSVDIGGGAQEERAGGSHRTRPFSHRLNQLVDESAETNDRRKLARTRSAPVCRTRTNRYLSFEQNVHASASQNWTPQHGVKMTKAWRKRGSKMDSDNCRMLEIHCQYDGNQRETDSVGRTGAKVRPGRRAIIGPVATLFRWYSKRNLDDRLATPVSPPDAPPVPIPHCWSASGREGVDYNMNTALDPTISFQEISEMLEDFRIVPQLIRRSDVKIAFKKVCRGRSAYECRRTPNPHPEDIRYPEFCDLITRVALAAFSREEDLILYPTPVRKIRALTSAMQVRTCRPKQLRDFLDLLAKRSSTRGAMRTRYKWDYVDSESRIFSSRQAATPEGWWPLCNSPAPQYLIDVLLEHDVATSTMYLPDWRLFSKPMLDMGSIPAWETRRFRVVIRNRTVREVGIHVGMENVPFGCWVFSQKPLASGIARVIDVEVAGKRGINTDEEFEGHIEIFGCDKSNQVGGGGDGEERHRIPLYVKFLAG